VAIAGSLFDSHASSVFPAAVDWLMGTLFGTVAVTLCVLAVAFVGLVLMSGRMAIRDALRVAIACFVLLGASAIAGGLRTMANEAVAPATAEQIAVIGAGQRLP
jgi:type IV secretion system protein VirB2